MHILTGPNARFASPAGAFGANAKAFTPRKLQ
jgi:hypothetical protein